MVLYTEKNILSVSRFMQQANRGGRIIFRCNKEIGLVFKKKIIITTATGREHLLSLKEYICCRKSNENGQLASPQSVMLDNSI